ncbi:unnamed protein product, partial [Phaeothamnion confervicola]
AHDVVPSTYEGTSSLPKQIVNGLTDLFNLFGKAAVEDTSPQAEVDPQTVLESVKGDFERNYLWTGDVDDAVFDRYCTFQDPTMQFQGLATYKRNVANLRDLVDRFVRDAKSELYSAELDAEAGCVRTRWRMTGRLALPWNPRIDVAGRTVFSYDPEQGNRITSYDEMWETSAAKALLQIITPG